MKDASSIDLDSRVLIHTVAVGDALYTQRVLRDSEMDSSICATMNEVCEEIGRGCAALLFAREALEPSAVERLVNRLAEEESWSHIPVIVLATSGDVSNAETGVTELFKSLRNLTLLERPVRILTLVGIVRGACRDRARQYQAREMIRRLHARKEELESSNEALRQFAYSVSHDLKEPLRTITLYMQLLSKRNENEPLDKDGLEYISQAVRGAKRMHGLINAILSYSQASTSELTIETVDTAIVFVEVIQNLAAAIAENTATVTARELPKLPGDKIQLTQLFQNLISNALKYRSEAPPVITVTGRETAEHWVISFVDNGIGFDESHSERIFEIFRRLHSSERYSGSGIGLALCKAIVQRHGGTISVKSAVGKGSAFDIRLPKLSTHGG